MVGLVLFAAAIHFLRDYDVLERYRYTIAAVGLLLLLTPRLPGIGQQVNGAYLGVKVGPLQFQPTEFSKICIVIFLASYLREHREVLIVGALTDSRRNPAAAQAPRPDACRLGASMFMLVFIRDLGSSLMFFAAFLALLYVATGRFSFVVIGMAMFRSVPGSSRRRCHMSESGSISGSTPTRKPEATATRSCSRSSPRPTAVSSARASARR